MAKKRSHLTRPLDGPLLISAVLDRTAVQSFEQYPFNLNAVKNLHELPFHPKVTFFVGENGSGKSTLLEALAVAMGLNPEGGSKNFNFATHTSHSKLHEYLRLGRGTRQARDLYFLRAESFYNVASEIQRLDDEPLGGSKIIHAYGGKSLHEQSHGESFFALFENRLRACGLYFLDEPEAALSPSRQMSFLALLHRYVINGCQFVIATHSPIIMAYPDAWIYSFDQDELRRIPYEETDHYRTTKLFLTFTEKMLKELMKGE